MKSTIDPRFQHGPLCGPAYGCSPCLTPRGDRRTHAGPRLAPTRHEDPDPDWQPL